MTPTPCIQWDPPHKARPPLPPVETDEELRATLRDLPIDPDLPPPSSLTPREWWRHNVSYLWDPSFTRDEDVWSLTGLVTIAIMLAIIIIGGFINAH